ncbi:MAG: NblA/ycf18 family protein [Pleurocapsa sp. MO_226.B13]|nr:NblA/ycf18 family protein [Pleurocapsa sp. MO_226.B13]
MSGSIELSLEQQFSIRAFEMQVQNLTCDQAQEFLVKLYKHMIVRDQMYKKLLKNQWGIEPCSWYHTKSV